MRFIAVLQSMLLVSGFQGSRQVWPQSAYVSAEELLAKMNTSQKLQLVYGIGGAYAGDVPAIGPLTDGSFIPAMNLHDGPQGVANGALNVTCWPAALTVVQSWDRSAMFSFGAGMGKEQFAKGSTVMLGPGVNLARVPWNGRNFEYQGEDPYLAYHMVYAETTGIQSQNISGCVKHFIFNNEEYDRGEMSANVDDRPARELYYRAFQGAIDAGVGSVRCSYNRVNRTYSCEEPLSLGILKGPLGFDGWVVSDWGATHSTIDSALAGLDQEMPDGQYFGAPLAAAIANGSVPSARLDDMVTRILTPMFALHIFDTGNSPSTRNQSSPAGSPAHNNLARELAQQSIALLANKVLPVSQFNIRSVAVFGDRTTVAGGGSGNVVAPYIVTPFDGIFSYLNNRPAPTMTGNCTMEANVDYIQVVSPATLAINAQDCCDACALDPGCHAWTYNGATSECFLKPNADGRSPAPTWPPLTSGNCSGGTVSSNDSGTLPYNVTYYGTTDAAEAEKVARSVDLVVVVVATNSREAHDRPSLFFPAWQDDLVSAVAAANVNSVVVARCPSACHMPWAHSVGAVLFEMLPGVDLRVACRSINLDVRGPPPWLGKLPITFPNPPSSGIGYPTDTWLSAPGGGPVQPTSYPGTFRGHLFPEVDYDEQLCVGGVAYTCSTLHSKCNTFHPASLIGYRWYDTEGTTPEFPFGHGLSYAHWTYKELLVEGVISSSGGKATVYATVCSGVGDPAAAEVAQLYVAFPAAADEPPQQLKGFQKVIVSPGGCAGVAFVLTAADLEIWNVTAQAWTLVPGSYGLRVGSSSRDIRMSWSTPSAGRPDPT